MDLPRLSGKERAALDLLVTNGEMYGLEMVKASSELKRGTVYVLLSRMADKGYVKSRAVKEENASGMPRRLFVVTGLGERALRTWRAAEVSFGEGGEAWA